MLVKRLRIFFNLLKTRVILSKHKRRGTPYTEIFATFAILSGIEKVDSSGGDPLDWINAPHASMKCQWGPCKDLEYRPPQQNRGSVRLYARRSWL